MALLAGCSSSEPESVSIRGEVVLAGVDPIARDLAQALPDNSLAVNAAEDSRSYGVNADGSCFGKARSGAVTGVTNGAEVVIADADGTTVGLAKLSDSAERPDEDGCVLKWETSVKLGDGDFFTVTIADGEPVNFSRADLTEGAAVIEIRY